MYRFFLKTLHKNKHNIHLIKSKIICTTIWYIPSWFSLPVRARGRNCFKAFLMISWLEPIYFHTHFILPINCSFFSKGLFFSTVTGDTHTRSIFEQPNFDFQILKPFNFSKNCFLKLKFWGVFRVMLKIVCIKFHVIRTIRTRYVKKWILWSLFLDYPVRQISLHTERNRKKNLLSSLNAHSFEINF